MRLAIFALYVGLVVFALGFVLVVLPWVSRATGASPEMVSIVTATLSLLVALASYLTLRNKTAKKDPAGTKE